MAQAYRAERWANKRARTCMARKARCSLHEKYRVSLRSKMIGFGASPAAAMRAAIQVEAQQLARFDVNPAVHALSILEVKTWVWYICKDGNVVPAVVAAVHAGKPPFFLHGLF